MSKAEIRPRWRVMSSGKIALGPGKIELLEALHSAGSITAAAKSMNMSYMRAWTLIRTMNACFKKPLVTASQGGSTGGGAELTPTGRQVLKLYREMDAKSLRAVSPSWKSIQEMLA